MSESLPHATCEFCNKNAPKFGPADRRLLRRAHATMLDSVDWDHCEDRTFGRLMDFLLVMAGPDRSRWLRIRTAMRRCMGFVNDRQLERACRHLQNEGGPNA